MTVDTEHPLDLDSARLTIKPPESRIDRQGRQADPERIAAAMTAFAKGFGRTAATYLESCIHCGSCAQACHYYAATEDPKMTPIWKIEPFKRAYRTTSGPFALLTRLFGRKAGLSVSELEEWQTLIYDSCTMCGRCSLICPMGIDIAALVGQARHAMFAAGLVPHELWAVAERAEREGSPLGATPKVLRERTEWLADEYGVEIPLDRESADVIVALSSIEIMKYPQSIVAIAKVMKHLGLSWTLRSDGYEATNFGMLSGNEQWQGDMSMKLINAAIACKAKLMVMPECGHAYGALRWQGANVYGKPLPFRVLHITELLSENVRNGKLRLRPVKQSLTFHDPCQISRRGGATQAARDVIRALGVDFREQKDSGDFGWCCGGGGGVVTIHRADELRYRIFEFKMKAIDDTGAELAVTACSNCRQTFDDGQAHFHWSKSMHSLLDLVADNLEP